MQRTGLVIVLILVAVGVLAAFMLLGGPSESERAADARRRFAASLTRGDYEDTAAAVNEFSRIRGNTPQASLILERIFPIGSTRAYPMESLSISGGFVRRCTFYSEVASAVTRNGATEGEKILALFDWTVTNAWPAHARTTPSGQSPYDIALAGTGAPVEICWLFVTMLENTGVEAVLLKLKLKEEEAPWWLCLVECGERWCLFAPDKGLPLVRPDGMHVADLRNLLNSEAHVPAGVLVDPKSVELVEILFASEAETFLPAAGDLEKLLAENGYSARCHKTVDIFGSYTKSIFDSARGSKEKVRVESPSLWSYPFHLEGGTGGLPGPEDVYFKTRALQLTGRNAEALKTLDRKTSGGRYPLVAAAALLGTGANEKALKALDGFEAKDHKSDTAAFIEGTTLMALGRASEAKEAFKRISGPRSALGTFLSGKAKDGARPRFKVDAE